MDFGVDDQDVAVREKAKAGVRRTRQSRQAW